MEIPKFKVRASCGGKIMTDPKGKSNFELFLDAKEKLSSLKTRLDGFKNKECKSAIDIEKNKIPETEKLIQELESIKDKKQLSETCKTYLKEWILSVKYGRKKDFGNKYTTKGNQTEQDGFQTIQDVLFKGKFLPKNKEYLENEYFCGTPDVIVGDFVIDNKSSWDIFTFPIGETEIPTKDYFYQLQIYAELSGKTDALLCYTLNNTPCEIIEDEIFRFKRQKNLIDITDQQAYEVAKNFIFTKEGLQENIYLYSNANTSDFIEIPLEKRLITFQFEKEQNVTDELKKRVINCREWIEENWNKF